MANDSTGVTVTSAVYRALIELQERSHQLSQSLPLLDDEQLRVLYGGLEGASAVAWQLQADIIGELQSRAAYGSNAVREIALFLGVPERRAFELAQIRRDLLVPYPTLRDLPLEKGHFLVALRARAHGQDPVESLYLAAERNLSVSVMRRKLQTGEEMDVAKKVRVRYYALVETEQKPDVLEREGVIQITYLSPVARIVRIGTVELLEFKHYDEEDEGTRGWNKATATKK